MEEKLKVSIITEATDEEDIFTVLTFESESAVKKGNHIYYKIDGKSKIENVRRHISKLKLDGIL